jgi:hypothetical protein
MIYNDWNERVSRRFRFNIPENKVGRKHIGSVLRFREDLVEEHRSNESIAYLLFRTAFARIFGPRLGNLPLE